MLLRDLLKLNKDVRHVEVDLDFGIAHNKDFTYNRVKQAYLYPVSGDHALTTMTQIYYPTRLGAYTQPDGKQIFFLSQLLPGRISRYHKDIMAKTGQFKLSLKINHRNNTLVAKHYIPNDCEDSLDTYVSEFAENIIKFVIITGVKVFKQT